MRARTASTVLAWLATASCLPRDSRPVPASVVVTVQSSDATTQGFATSDGWAIHFSRVVTSIGTVRLDNYPARSTSCNSYSQTDYDRLFDFTKVTGAEKVGLVYGLGKCSVTYRLRAPSVTDLVEIGATQADLAFMRTRVTDPTYGLDGRVGLIVQGTATKNGTVERFDWDFRRSFTVNQCKTAALDGFVNVPDLKGNDALTLPVEVRAEELFRAAPRDDAPFAFDPIAAADTNGFGLVSVDDLARVPAPPGSTDTGSTGAGGAGGASASSSTGTGAGGASGGLPTPPTLGDVVYQLLLPRVARVLGGGPCTTSLRPTG